MGISTVLLSYKEADNLDFLLPKIIENLDKIREDYEILVIDTETPMDNTEEVCLKYGARYINQEWPSFGGAFRTGIKYANKDKFLILDSDGSHNPEYIPAMMKKFNDENCDVVIGSRYIAGGKTYDTKSSIVMSKILNSCFRICLGIKAKDISTDYRIYRTDQLKRVILENKNYDILQEVLLKLRMNKKDLKIGEIPITFSKRVFGESKRKLMPFIISYIRSLFRLTCIRIPIFKTAMLYFLFGIAAAVIDYSVFSILLGIKITSKPEIANVIGALMGFIFSFSTNTFLNFKKRDKLIKRFSSYAVICIIGMMISTTLMYIFKNIINVYLLKVLLLVLVSGMQFVMNKCITYRD